MTQVLTVRMPPDLVAKADARAAELGLDRGKYVRSLIEQDVSEHAGRRPKRTFTSEDFIGSVPLARGPYTNRRVRAIVRERLVRRRSLLDTRERDDAGVSARGGPAPRKS